jgi:hypothetical protein
MEALKFPVAFQQGEDEVAVGDGSSAGASADGGGGCGGGSVGGADRMRLCCGVPWPRASRGAAAGAPGRGGGGQPRPPLLPR